ncbi:SCO-spondin [Drosophila eugracilis]|uniref:SCO-spondin n=1 Tax=Drosophila eugracilis TaxID=29029 RepID=UPI0007E8270D|nr:SCO-spondin [Drosophila eugracilis]
MYSGLFLFVFLWLLHHTTSSEIPLIKKCMHNDVMVNCVPVCPKICSLYYYTRRCSPQKCKRGCACPKGWLRDLHPQGYCVPKKTCQRYIIQ